MGKRRGVSSLEVDAAGPAAASSRSEGPSDPRVATPGRWTSRRPEGGCQEASWPCCCNPVSSSPVGGPLHVGQISFGRPLSHTGRLASAPLYVAIDRDLLMKGPSRVDTMCS